MLKMELPGRKKARPKRRFIDVQKEDMQIDGRQEKKSSPVGHRKECKLNSEKKIPHVQSHKFAHLPMSAARIPSTVTPENRAIAAL